LNAGDCVAKGDLQFEMFAPLIGSSSADLVRALQTGDQRITDSAHWKLGGHGMSDAPSLSRTEARAVGDIDGAEMGRRRDARSAGLVHGHRRGPRFETSDDLAMMLGHPGASA
jgi:hypothetical protein